MQVTAEQLKRIAKGTPDSANVRSVVLALNQYGTQFGLDLPHRLAQFIAQVAHESGSFRYDKEIASGAAYEGRKDLGNTQKGDGKKFKGRGPIQVTGRRNYRAFTAWVRKFIPDAPDFEQNPDLINTDPYEGLSAIWYWAEGNPTGKSLNVYADQNNLEMITRKINGGLNGLSDRLDYYDRTAFILLGYKLGQYEQLQAAAKRKGWYGGKVDNLPGPQTRAAMHMLLVHMTDPNSVPDGIMAAPVVERQEVEKTVEVEKSVETPVPVPVAPASLDKPFYKDPDFAKEVVTGGVGTTAISSVAGADWKVVAIVAFAIFVVGGAFWYFNRRSKQAAVQTQVQAVNQQAAAIRSAIS